MPKFSPIQKLCKPLGAALFMALIMTDPAASSHAAAQALQVWFHSIAPSLLPFLIAMPALTDGEICRLFHRISGRLISFLRLPENSSGALLIGLLSGSPAGAAALANVPVGKSDSVGSFTRAAWLASGASSAFLLSSVALGMLNMPQIGTLLLRSQLGSVLLCAVLLRRLGSDVPRPIRTAAHPAQSAALSAMLTLLGIGGFMVFFSVLARRLSALLSPSLEPALLAVLELSLGAQALASLNAPLALKLPLISAAACFGGVSVCTQCLSFLQMRGISSFEYVSGKLIQSAFAALLTHIQLTLAPLDRSLLPPPSAAADVPTLSALAVGCILLLTFLLASSMRRKPPKELRASKKEMPKS